MRLFITADEIAQALPPAGPYIVRINSVILLPPKRPVEIELLLAVLRPETPPRLIHDRFVFRGEPRRAIPGMRRLLLLFQLAGVHVHPNVHLDTEQLLGLELLIEVQQRPGPAGFPYSRIVSYDRPWNPQLAKRTQPGAEHATRFREDRPEPRLRSSDPDVPPHAPPMPKNAPPVAPDSATTAPRAPTQATSAGPHRREKW